jgi:hypothetical protein
MILHPSPRRALPFGLERSSAVDEHPCSRNEGSALLVVLLVLTLFLIFGSIVATLATRQLRYVQHDVHEVQARYAAESGIVLVMARLATDPTWRPDDVTLALPGGSEARVTVRPYGGFFEIRSTAEKGGQQIGVRAIVGSNHRALRYALVLGDVSTPLHVAGAATIDGTLLLGSRGLRHGTIRGVPWHGGAGPIQNGGEHPLPPFDPTHIESELVWLDDALDAPPEDAHIVIFAGKANLTEADSERWRHPVVVLVTGDLQLDNGFSARPGSWLAATGSIRIGPRVGSHTGLVYARTHILVSGARTAGQLFARDSVRVEDGSYLRYPSLVYTSGRLFGAENHGSIRLSGRSTVDGSVLYPGAMDDAVRELGRVTIEPDALVRGVVYSAGQTDLRGTIYGSIFTHQLYHFSPPQTFINWLVDGAVTHDHRPASYLFPVGLDGVSHLAVLDREELSPSRFP